MNLRALWYIFQSFQPPPIFILPGLGGSIIYNKGTKETIYPPNARAFLNPNDFLHDFNVSYLEKKFVPNVPSCVGPIGDTKHIKVVPNWMIPFVKHNYFHSFLHYFQLQYPHHKIQSVPYDYRLVGNKESRESLYRDLQKAIEYETKKENKKSILIAHSLGGLVLHDFLSRQNITWKRSYIDKIITINTPYLGSIQALAMVNGKKRLNIPVLEKIDYLSNLSAFLWLIPNPHFNKDTVLDYDTNTTIASIIDLVPNTLWERIQYHFKEDFLQIGIQNNVTTHVIYSCNIPTKLSMNEEHTEALSFGDGLIGIESLTFPKQWENQDLLHFHPIKDYDHTKILNSPQVFQLLMEIIRSE